jgi:hypothetical protein
MELIGWVVLVPLSLASLLTGLVSSPGSAWRLFRHYWVLFTTTLSSRQLGRLRDPSPTLHAAAALLLLLVATTLAIYKHGGMTRYGQRRHHQRRTLLVR